MSDERTNQPAAELRPPRWTVTYNIVSPESDAWVGTGWEFFNDEAEAKTCYERHATLGNAPTKRPFYSDVDIEHLGIAALRRLNTRTQPPVQLHCTFCGKGFYLNVLLGKHIEEEHPTAANTTHHQPPAVPLSELKRYRFGEFDGPWLLEKDVLAALTTTPATSDLGHDEQITHDEVVQAITDMQEGRDSHVQWAAHLRNTNRHDCQGCADHAAHIGEASYHDEWIEKYDLVIRLLARVPYSTPATSEAQTCVKCGHNDVDERGLCQTNLPPHPTKYGGLLIKCCSCHCVFSAPEPSPAKTCVKCGHEDEYFVDGRCVKITTASFVDITHCGCRCVFPDTSPTSEATPSVSAAIAEVERLRDEWASIAKRLKGLHNGKFNGVKYQAACEILDRLRALPPDARAVDGDAREVAQEIVSKSAETRYLTSKGVDVLCSEENLINAIAAAITATKKETK